MLGPDRLLPLELLLLLLRHEVLLTRKELILSICAANAVCSQMGKTRSTARPPRGWRATPTGRWPTEAADPAPSP